jgi:hypothetical protein
MKLATWFLLLAPAWSAPVHGAPFQDTPVVDERPELKGLLDELGGHLKARGEKDPEAIGVIDKLVQEFPNCGPKDRAAVVKALAGCFGEELEEGVPDDRIYRASAVALGTMGPESAKPLMALIGDKAHRKNLSLQQTLALSLGKTKNVEGLKTLLGLLKHKDAPMQASGAEALANFFDSPVETRKAVFEELLKTLMDQKAKKDNVTDLEAQERWNTISGPILETLQKISGHGETDPDQWLRWWNDNKRKDWGAKSE